MSEDWTRFGKKQILSIGKKRQRLHDEEDDEIDVSGGHEYNSSSDEEEGRTSAVKEKKRKVRPPVATPTIAAASGLTKDVTSSVDVDAVGTAPSSKKKKKKKKKGKKERSKENAEEAEVTTTTPAKDASTEDETKNGKENADSKSDDITQTAEDAKKNNPTTKRKRPKVRSRQKNIRKDNRSANDRPTHLVLGRSEFSGRYMTQETKKKLGIKDAPAKKNNRKANKAVSADAAFDSVDWVGGDKTSENANEGGGNNDEGGDYDDGDAGDNGASEPTESSKSKGEDGGQTLTKIGDCIVDVGTASKPVSMNDQDVGEDIVSENKDKRKKKKQKRKFKNLVVG